MTQPTPAQKPGARTEQDNTFTAAMFGPSGKGKTMAALRAFPDAHVFTASRDATASWTSCYPDLAGVLRVKETVVGNLAELRAGLKATPRGARIVVDDASEIAQRHVVQLKAKGVDGYDLWGNVQDNFLRCREETIQQDRAAIWTFHERPPEPNPRGELDPGGPRLPSRTLTAMVPHLVGTVGRVVLNRNQGANVWPAVLWIDPTNGDWITKDRYNATALHTPLSLREIIARAQRTTHPHFTLPPRPKGLEWMDGAVDWLASCMLQGMPDGEVPKYLTDATPQATPSVRHWIHQDAATRVAIEKARTNRFAAYT